MLPISSFFSPANYTNPHHRRFRELVLIGAFIILVLIWFDYRYVSSDTSSKGSVRQFVGKDESNAAIIAVRKFHPILGKSNGKSTKEQEIQPGSAKDDEDENEDDDDVKNPLDSSSIDVIKSSRIISDSDNSDKIPSSNKKINSGNKGTTNLKVSDTGKLAETPRIVPHREIEEPTKRTVKDKTDDLVSTNGSPSNSRRTAIQGSSEQTKNNREDRDSGTKSLEVTPVKVTQPGESLDTSGTKKSQSLEDSTTTAPLRTDDDESPVLPKSDNRNQRNESDDTQFNGTLKAAKFIGRDNNLPRIQNLTKVDINEKTSNINIAEAITEGQEPVKNKEVLKAFQTLLSMLVKGEQEKNKDMVNPFGKTNNEKSPVKSNNEEKNPVDRKDRRTENETRSTDDDEKPIPIPAPPTTNKQDNDISTNDDSKTKSRQMLNEKLIPDIQKDIDSPKYSYFKRTSRRVTSSTTEEALE